MPAPRLPWIKFWPEAIEHEKFSVLKDAEAWTWVVVWAKASQQPQRWRFASVQHARHVTGRPLAHIRRLIEVRLLDQTDDGLVIHDARHWQDAANLTPTHREGWRNGDASLIEQPANGDGSLTESDRTVRMDDLEGEGEGDREREGEKDGTPVLRTGARTTKKVGNPRVQATLDALRELHSEVHLTPRDYAALKRSSAPPELIAETYDAVARGTWGDDFMRKRLSVHEAIEWANAYAARRDEGIECSCTERLEWLKVNRNSNPYCELHGDVREVEGAS